jgi:flagella basal body P-ring formation protein FlgA
MIKRFVLSVVVLGAVLGASAPAAAAPRDGTNALLRAHVLVDGPMVTLGDLFDNAGERANAQVMRAPPPGTHVTVDTDWLAHVALVNNLSWKPRDLFDEAVIERTGLTIGRDQIAAALQAALAARGAPAGATVDLESRTQQIWRAAPSR